MLKFLKLAMVVWLLFVIASIAFGGDKLRSMSQDTGSVIEKIMDMAADKADRLKDEADAVMERIDRWAGKKNEVALKNNL